MISFQTPDILKRICDNCQYSPEYLPATFEPIRLTKVKNAIKIIKIFKSKHEKINSVSNLKQFH